MRRTLTDVTQSEPHGAVFRTWRHKETAQLLLLLLRFCAPHICIYDAFQALHCRSRFRVGFVCHRYTPPPPPLRRPLTPRGGWPEAVREGVSLIWFGCAASRNGKSQVMIIENQSPLISIYFPVDWHTNTYSLWVWRASSSSSSSSLSNMRFINSWGQHCPYRLADGHCAYWLVDWFVPTMMVTKRMNRQRRFLEGGWGGGVWITY